MSFRGTFSNVVHSLLVTVTTAALLSQCSERSDGIMLLTTITDAVLRSERSDGVRDVLWTSPPLSESLLEVRPPVLHHRLASLRVPDSILKWRRQNVKKKKKKKKKEQNWNCHSLMYGTLWLDLYNSQVLVPFCVAEPSRRIPWRCDSVPASSTSDSDQRTTPTQWRTTLASSTVQTQNLRVHRVICRKYAENWVLQKISVKTLFLRHEQSFMRSANIPGVKLVWHCQGVVTLSITSHVAHLFCGVLHRQIAHVADELVLRLLQFLLLAL